MAGKSKQTRQDAGTRSARNRKIARIWCLAKELGMDGDMLHVAVESITGKDSIAALSPPQLVTVVCTLEIEKKKQKRRKSYERGKRSAAGVGYLPSPDQREKVRLLIERLTPLIDLRSPEAYLNTICRRSFQKDYSKLGRNEMQALIEALKSIIKRSQSSREGR